MWVCSSGFIKPAAAAPDSGDPGEKGFVTPFPRENVEFDTFIRSPEPELFDTVGVDDGEGDFVCLFSTVLTVTVVPAGIFLVSDSAFLLDS